MELRYRGRVVAVRPKGDMLEVELESGEILFVAAASAPAAWPGAVIAPSPADPTPPPPSPEGRPSGH